MVTVRDCGHACWSPISFLFHYEGEPYEKYQHLDYHLCCICNYNRLLDEANLIDWIDPGGGDHYEDTKWNLHGCSLEEKLARIKKIVFRTRCECITKLKEQDQLEEFEDFFRRR